MAKCYIVKLICTHSHPIFHLPIVIVMMHPMQTKVMKPKNMALPAETPMMTAHGRKVYAGERTREKLASAMHLVDLLDGRAVIGVTASRSTSTGEAASASTREAARSTTLTTGAVELHHDGVGDSLKLLLLRLVLVLGGLLVVIEPRDGLVDLGLELLLVASIELLVNLGVAHGVAQRVGVGLESVLGADAGSLSLILGLVLLGLGQHALDLLLGETALVVGDDNLVGLAGALLDGGHVHDTVGIHVEGDLNLGNTARSRGDTSELELAHQVVVLCPGTFAFVHLDEHTGLVVGEGGEDLGLLSGDGGVPLDERSHDTTSGLDTQGQRGDVQKQDLVGGLARSVTREDSSLDGSTVGDGLVGVDGLVGLLAVEEVGDHLLDLGDTGGTADEDDLVDGRLVDLSVAEDTLNGLHGGAEEVLAQLLETSTGDAGVEVNTLEQGVDLDGGLSGRGESALGTLACCTETTKGAGVSGQVLLMFSELCQFQGTIMSRIDGSAYRLNSLTKWFTRRLSKSSPPK